VLLAALAVFSIVLGWAVIQTTFTLIYARVYYTPPSGGIDFEDGDPDFRDFAYMAFTIGMTYQVSDTGISQKRIRHIVLRHAILFTSFGNRPRRARKPVRGTIGLTAGVPTARRRGGGRRSSRAALWAG